MAFHSTSLDPLATTTHLRYDELTPIDPLAQKLQPKLVKHLRVFLRDWQAQAVGSLMRGRDLIVKAGTGAGKTMVYWSLIAKKENGIVLILSPLKSVMNDQVYPSKHNLIKQDPKVKGTWH